MQPFSITLSGLVNWQASAALMKGNAPYSLAYVLFNRSLRPLWRWVSHTLIWQYRPRPRCGNNPPLSLTLYILLFATQSLLQNVWYDTDQWNVTFTLCEEFLTQLYVRILGEELRTVCDYSGLMVSSKLWKKPLHSETWYAIFQSVHQLRSLSTLRIHKCQRSLKKVDLLDCHKNVNVLEQIPVLQELLCVIRS